MENTQKILSLLLITIFIISPIITAAQEIPSTTPEVSIEQEFSSPEITATTEAVDEVVEETPALDLESLLPFPNTTDETTQSEESLTEEVSEENVETKLLPEPSFLLSDDPETEAQTPDLNSFSKSILPNINKTNGALTQRIKLDIPPGRAGIEPEIVLDYNSQRTEDGLFGYGWSVSIPYIERINRTGTENLYIDNYFTSSLGGELLNISTSTPTDYRNKIEDGSFIKYTFSNNTWVAYDKKGTRYTFGTTAQAQKSATTTPLNVYRWMLEEIRDQNNNFVRFEYQRENNELYPYKIYYTGHNTTDGIFTVEFIRSSRPDPYLSYKTGFKVLTEKRITEIDTYFNASLVRRYELGYMSGSNGTRSLLSSITKTGRDLSSNNLTLPPITFSYISSTTAFMRPGSPNLKNNTYILTDVHGNALNDTSVFYKDTTAGDAKVARVNGNSIGTAAEIWARSTFAYAGFTPERNGVRFFDVNGDSKAEIVQGYRAYDATTTQNIYFNTYATSTGYSWVLGSTTGTVPVFDYTTDNQASTFNTGLLGNLNGDNLVDYSACVDIYITCSAYFGNGSGWNATTTLFSAVHFMPGPTGAPATNSQLVDINGDGLDDWVYSDGTKTYVRINTGFGWESFDDSRWTIGTSTIYLSPHVPYELYWDRGMRFLDINGDGLNDFVRSYQITPYSSSVVPDIEVADVKLVYLNTGSGWATSTSFANILPSYITTGNHSGGIWSGDIIYDEYGNWNGNGQQEQDVMSAVNYSTGGSSQIEYSLTAQQGYHPELPISLLTVKKITTNDNNGNSNVTNYSYYGGKMNVISERDRTFAGFASTTESTTKLLKTTYFNQGDGLVSLTSEQTDNVAQSGQIYREDLVNPDTSSVLKKTFKKWETFDQGNNRSFFYLSKVLEQDFASSTHRDKATEYTYSTTTGYITQVNELGEVAGSSDGTYSDFGYDQRIENITYATNATSTLTLPINRTFLNASSTKVKEIQYLYDGLSYGSVNFGNVTQEKNWIVSSTYASTTAAYNSYGLPTQKTDNIGNMTMFTYDANNIYVATSTNPLSQDTSFIKDYASGITIQLVDANSIATQNVLDPVGRVTEKKISNPLSPGSIVTVFQTTYGDATSTLYTLSTTTLSSATSTSFYTYMDGLGKPIQYRKTAEGTNTYTVSDLIYNEFGELEFESLPYFASSTTKSSATTTASLYKHQLYDSMGRLVSMGTSIGTTTYTHAPWQVTITDPRGYDKDLINDAHGNLSQVNEHNDPQIYITRYYYDALNNLIHINDAGSSAETNSHSVFFSSTGQYASHADDNAYDIGSSFTIMGWIKAAADSANTYDKYIFSKLSGGVGYTLVLSNGGYLFGGINGAGIGNQTGYADNIYNQIQLDNGSWYHVALTYNGTTAKLYIDGVLAADKVMSSPNTDNSTDFVVSRNHATDFFAGYIDGIRIYSGALTPTEINTVKASQDTSSVSGLRALYNFNNNYDDDSGNNNDLTASGSPTFSSTVPFASSGSSISNMRTFGYDGLSRRTIATDLHAPSDITYATWNYEYNSQNLASTNDTKGQNVTYTYDGLNRVVAENYLGSAGTEITYTYDTCLYGKGKLCITSTTSSYKNLTYNTLGLVEAEGVKVNNLTATTTLTYDRQGNITKIVYPDSREVEYAHNNAGLLESVKTKPNGGAYSDVVSNLNYIPTEKVSLKEFANGLKTTNIYDSAEMYRLTRMYTGTTSPDVISIPGGNTHSTSLTRSSSQYWSITDAAQTGLDLNGTWTISLWIKIGTAPSSGQNYGLVSKVDAAQNAFELVYANESGTKKIKIYNEDGSTGVDSYYNVDLGTNTWHHIVAVRTPSAVAHFWIDGVDHAATGALQATTRNSSNPFQIGTGGLSGANNDKFDGLIDDVRVWTRAISSQEISDLYSDSSNFSNSSDLQGWWKFNNDGTDDSSNSNDLTGTNSPAFNTDVPYGASGSYTPTGIQDLNFEYDENNNIVSLTDESNTLNNKTVTFEYDGLNRLTLASTTSATSTPYIQTFTYNAVGSLLTKSDVGTYLYDGTNYTNPHAPTSISGVTQAYDNNGNLTSDGTYTNGWNYRNRLTSIGTGVSTTTFSYDERDQRLLKSTASTTSLYWGNKFYSLASTTSFGTTTATTTVNIWAGDELIGYVEGNGTATSTYSTYSDLVGSINVVTDSSGNVVQTTDYYPYGEKRVYNGTSESERQFISQVFDEQANLNYLNARYYDGARGQFLSEDPVFWELKQNLENPQSLNSYAYANGNPIVNKDPNGRAVFDLSINGGGVLVGGYVGFRFDTKGSHQTYFGTTYGPSVGISGGLGISSGYLDTTQEKQDYVTRDLIVVPGAGFNRSKTAIQNPSDPFDFSNDPQVSYNFSIGLSIGLTQGFRTEGKVQSNKQTSTYNQNSSSLNRSISSPTVSGSSGASFQSLSSSLSQLQAALMNYSASLSASSQVSKKNN